VSFGENPSHLDFPKTSLLKAFSVEINNTAKYIFLIVNIFAQKIKFFLSKNSSNEKVLLI